jgi:hypothetical protein
MRIDLYTKTIPYTHRFVSCGDGTETSPSTPSRPWRTEATPRSNSRIAGATTRSLIPAVAMFGNMATMATLNKDHDRDCDHR